MRFLPSSYRRRLVLLSPARLATPIGFGKVEWDGPRYWEMMAAMQRLRGAVYLSDGAIGPADLTSDGRHWQPADGESWHVLSVDSRGRVHGCARYRAYEPPVRFEQLGVSSAAQHQSEEWGECLRRSVASEIDTCSRRRLKLVELGGWALSEEVRGGLEALRLALSMYALAGQLGHCIGLTTATVRHCSAAILRKIGGRPASAAGRELPRYYDPRYGCEMDILRFDSSAPNPRFATWIDGIRSELQNVQVMTPCWEGAAQAITSSPAHALARRDVQLAMAPHAF